MIDSQIISTFATVAGGVGAIITVMGAIYSIFINDMSPTGAIIISAMGLILFALLVLAIDNRIRINEFDGDGQ